jgi:hypothetical protein
MSKESRKPSFNAPAVQKDEDASWAYRSETDGSTVAAVASGTPHETLTARTARHVTTVADIVTYPASLAVLVVLVPFARLAALCRR